MVEERLGRPFVDPVRVHVCASMESFDRYGGDNNRGVTIARRVFLSPKAAFGTQTIPRWLVAHELAHLHLQQRRRGWLEVLFSDSIPRWFLEGLAVYASNGIEHEKATETDAWRSIAQGSHILSKRSLSHSMFFRQSGMFIGYLARRDPAKFKQIVVETEDGSDVARVFESVFGKNLDTLWQEFAAEGAKDLNQ